MKRGGVKRRVDKHSSVTKENEKYDDNEDE